MASGIFDIELTDDRKSEDDDFSMEEDDEYSSVGDVSFHFIKNTYITDCTQNSREKYLPHLQAHLMCEFFFDDLISMARIFI
jgi:hypothetical protein